MNIKGPVGLVGAYSENVAEADRLLSRGDIAGSAEFLCRALAIAFHRVVHFDRTSSPLAADPAGYAEPFRLSSAAQAVAAPRGRAVPAARVADGRPVRLLIVTGGNSSFVAEIEARYADDAGFEVRHADLARDPGIAAQTAGGVAMMIEHALGGRPEFGVRIEEALRPHLDWADTVFVDWCNRAAGILSLLDPGGARVVLRLHSFEAFSCWPWLVDFSRVDDLVVVSEHIRDLVGELYPHLAGVPVHVVRNALDLEEFVWSKPTEARFNLGMVGFGQVVKDPCWALEVLGLLRAVDERYRLLLVGSDFPTARSAAGRLYARQFAQQAAEAGEAVRMIGRTEDVPSALTEVGVILSTSVREGFPCGLVEGAASGAVPVVRDWPFFAGSRHGARTLFPKDWVVATPREAADRILMVTADEHTWREAGAATSAHALAAWDWSLVRQDFDDLLAPPVSRR